MHKYTWSQALTIYTEELERCYPTDHTGERTFVENLIEANQKYKTELDELFQTRDNPDLFVQRIREISRKFQVDILLGEILKEKAQYNFEFYE